MRRLKTLEQCIVAVLLTAVHCTCVCAEIDIYDHAARIGQAVNFGNTLEAPREGDWGFRLNSSHFRTVAEGGFDSVRVPIRWSAHASASAPYTIDSEFFERIDWVVDQAKRNDLGVILDMHHYDEIFDDPDGHRGRFVEMWRQIADRYRDEPDTVYFELLNEPHADLNEIQWNSILAETLSVVRETNPDRPVIVGPDGWNSLHELDKLRLPEHDRNLIATYHYYSPFQFTHQGAEWVNGSEPWLGTTWNSNRPREAAISRDFDTVAEWSRENDRPVLLGEFGAYEKADIDSRRLWTRFVSNAAAERGFSWAYWEFGAGFGVFDRSQKRWVTEIYEALRPRNMFDTNLDMQLDRDDYDALLIAMQLGATDRFDFDHSGTVDEQDLGFWSHFAGPRSGDLDANGIWDATDIDLLSDAVREVSPNGRIDYRFDLNRDGSVDGSDRAYWIQSVMNTYAGDVNLDGEFNSADMVAVFKIGAYENPTFDSVGWADGDWNGDRQFDSGDFVVAFAGGGYEKGPRPAVVAVPEPSSVWPVVLALCFNAKRRRLLFRR